MGLLRSHLRGPGPPDPAPPRLAALLDPLPEALPQATQAAHVAPGPGALTGGLSRQLCDRQSWARGGPSCLGHHCHLRGLQPASQPPAGLHFPLCNGHPNRPPPPGQPGARSHEAAETCPAAERGPRPPGASWAGGGGAGECWLGGAAASGTTTGSGPGLPCPPCSGLPSSLTQESLVFAGS